MSDRLGQRFDELSRGVLGPIVLGGALRPVRPLGPSLALTIGRGRTISDADLRSRIAVARVRRARRLLPVDVLPEVDAWEWALAAALNDLLQATNHELSGALTRGRHARLLASVVALCDAVPPPRTLEAALARHATFARVLEVARTDTVVSWWTGSRAFRGQPPSPRLLAWRKLRRVRVEPQRVGLVDMCAGLDAVAEGPFLEALTSWLTRTPLTDLATSGRATPPFAWSAPTLSLVGAPAGRSLAWRALSRASKPRVLSALRRACDAVAEGPAKQTAAAFLAEVELAQATFAGPNG